ncbi:M20 family metallopeptidase [Bradyrhizobium elkanii]|uniref:M20 family metallopeptidase n=1 Tax=Bradyrhizobium elkanii TaxID=29448 RepID=UPI000841E6A9|nr:M20 family metallopeptidase [Bradyrhizobium elkanii]ODM84678.1 hypothetical protein A6452_16875 [Bradyrhizobium elkanii]ODM86510.1 hypothetical protein A6X20_01585 [Bradyrhizobium elkanii]
MFPPSGLRKLAVDMAVDSIQSGALQDAIDRRVRLRTESQSDDGAEALRDYLTGEMSTTLQRLGFTCRIIENTVHACAPFLIAERHEDDLLPTVLLYGHGDVVHGKAEAWRTGLSPWRLTIDGDRWYGRGTADNKGQHSINLAALESVLDVRAGRLGCNVKWLFETGEEIGSPGLRELCRAEKGTLAADVFIASDGPRLTDNRPTIFLGSRGSVSFSLSVTLRETGLHSGNWGGLKRNPATLLAAALATMVDQRGRIQLDGLKPSGIPEQIRQAIIRLRIDEDVLGEPIDTRWGEEGMSAAERLLGWNALEVLTLSAGDPQKPVNAIPPSATARCQLRFVVGTPWREVTAALRNHFDRNGFEDVEITLHRCTPATRGDPGAPWVKWAEASLRATTGKDIAVMPNLGGTLPNDIFVDVLELPTIWIPHSHPGCRQHASDEHLLASVAAEGLQVMAGIFWDLGDGQRAS